MPTNDITYKLLYKSHRTYLTNRMGSISCHIMPLGIHSLRGGHTQTFVDRNNSKPPRAWFKKYPSGWITEGLLYIYIYIYIYIFIYIFFRIYQYHVGQLSNIQLLFRGYQYYNGLEEHYSL